MNFSTDESIVKPIIIFFVEVLAVVSIAWLLVYGFGESTKNIGQSMDPTINNEDTVLIDKFTYSFRDPARYDLIAFNLGESTDTSSAPIILKRIIGLPGETVQIKDNKVFINDNALPDSENWTVADIAGIANEPITLSDNEYFVLGDNRQGSEDSRFESVGNVKRNNIIGRIWARSNPISKFRLY